MIVNCIHCGVAVVGPEYLGSVCRGCILNRQRKLLIKKKKADPFLKKMHTVARRANKKKIDIDIDVNYIKGIWTGICPIFHAPISIKHSSDDDYSGELDRVDITKGYIKGNVVWVSRRANRLKNEATLEEVEKIYQWLKKFFNK